MSRSTFGRLIRALLTGTLVVMLVPGLASAVPATGTATPNARPMAEGTVSAEIPDLASTLEGGDIAAYPVIWGDAFEDFSNWHSVDYATNPWVLSNYYVYSPPYSAAHLYYVNDEGSWLDATLAADLTSARAPVLVWNMAYDTEPGYDEIWAGVYDADAGTYSTFAGPWSGLVNTYEEFSADMSDWAGGGNLYPYFGLTSNPSVAYADGGYVGVVVDDVRIIDVNPNVPVAVDDAYGTLREADLVVAAPGVLGNDTDADGDTLTALLYAGASNGLVILNSDGSFTYSPNADFAGVDYFSYVAHDGAGQSNVATVQITVTADVTIEDKAAGVTFDRFVPSVGAAYSGGTYIYGRWAGTRIESRFTGTKIAWYGPKQPAYGKADVYIDGVYKATVDCYAPSGSATVSAKLWESATLGAGSHTISIRLTGAKNAASAGNIVVVDKLVASGTGAGNPQARANETAGTFTGAWIPTASTTYTDGTYRYSRWAGAKISYTFTGTKVAWIGPRALNYGRADVYIDGVKKATVSQYGALGWRYRVWESATLAAGQHTIEIRVLGTKEAASTNTIVVVDGFDVKP